MAKKKGKKKGRAKATKAPRPQMRISRALQQKVSELQESTAAMRIALNELREAEGRD